MRLTNVDGSLLFVSSKYPHFDVGTPQGGDALRNILQEEREEEEAQKLLNNIPS